ncbi:MAG: hypothetical protein JNN25_11245 [Candidatus Kapabacteria bacterium]|nr:hypothetical protein [Candidatus Kapabacteria bacterium]
MNASFREQVHLYCEGLLPEYAENALFAELSANSDLRAEMTEHLKLLAAVKSHAASLRPASGTKNALFAELGLSLPQSAVQSATPNAAAAITLPQAAVGTGATLGGQSTLFTVFLSLFSSVATAFAVLFFLQTGWFQGGSKITDGGARPPFQNSSLLASDPTNRAFMPHDTIRETTTIVRYVPIVQNAADLNTTNHSDADGIQASHPNSLPTNDSEEASQQAQELPMPIPIAQEPQPSYPYQNTPISAFSSNPLSQEVNSSLPLHERPISNATEAPIFSRTKLGIIAGIRGVRSRSLPEATVEANSYPLFNNTALSLMLPISPTGALGIEVGQEAYFLRYRTILPEQEQIVGIEKNPVLAWAGVSYRHTFLPNDLFSPVMNFTLGGTSIGAMGRTMLGLQYSIDTKTRCTLGLEASSLLYIHREVWNFSPNIGITYGISFEL